MKKKADAYEAITNHVIAQLESVDLGSWEKPWINLGGARPVSMSTGKHYNGINRFILMTQPYCDSRWGTYNAWKKEGGQVRKGEKGTPIILFNFIEEKDEKTGKIKTIPFSRLWWVFNAEQVDGVEAQVEAEPLALAERLANAEEFIGNTGAHIQHGGDRACYSPALDHIQLPPVEAFKSTQAYYGTALHELGHWTGHKSRCERDLSGGFGSESYAFEELVAELTATFLCADLSIENLPRKDHAQYIKAWLKALKNDKRAIYKAAKLAQQASDFLGDLQAPESEAEAA